MGIVSVKIMYGLSWNTAGKTHGFYSYQKMTEASGSTEMVVLALT
jgi:hypothetical protein